MKEKVKFLPHLYPVGQSQYKIGVNLRLYQFQKVTEMVKHQISATY